jgi:hypothetical protein
MMAFQFRVSGPSWSSGCSSMWMWSLPSQYLPAALGISVWYAEVGRPHLIVLPMSCCSAAVRIGSIMPRGMPSTTPSGLVAETCSATALPSN